MKAPEETAEQRLKEWPVLITKDTLTAIKLAKPGECIVYIKIRRSVL